MLEQDFEKLLARYFEDELGHEDLAMLAQTVQRVPAHRRRYQREIRIHTLLRESAMILREGDTQSQKSMVVRRWRRVATIAALLIFLGALTVLFYRSWNAPEDIGYCLHVSEVDEIALSRNGKSIPIKIGTILRAGDRIQTEGDAQVSSKLLGIGTVTISGNSEIVLAGASQRIAIDVKRGKLLLEAENRSQGTLPVVLETPKVELEVMGTLLGLEVDPVATRVRVHEGRVKFHELTTGRATIVNAGQFCVNGEEWLEALDQAELLPDTLMPGTLRLSATADLFTDRNTIQNGQDLKVENGRRISYLKFNVPEMRDIFGAKLRLKQSVDPGVGTLEVWEGSHHNWSEQTSSISDLPKPMRVAGAHGGWVKLNQEIEIDVSSLIQKPGIYTILIFLEGVTSNDIWFGSRESNCPPELILHVNPESL